MYRNSEGYADPTVGSTLSHIAYMERKKRRDMKRAEQKMALPQITEAERKQRQERRKAIRRKQTEEQFRNAHWVLAWSEDPLIEAQIREGQNAAHPSRHNP